MDPSDVIAALVWDRPALAASDSPGARDFVYAMDLRHIDPRPNGEPLSNAAHAVLSEVSGDGEAALGAYRQLSQSDDELVRLLGLTLLCWSDIDPDPLRVGPAQAAIEHVADDELRARLTTKLIAAAFDHGWDELLPQLFAQAKNWAPPGSALARLIDQEAYNLLGDPLPMGPYPGDDELSEYQWIRDIAADAAQTALKKSIEERGRSPWTLSFTLGGAPLNRPFAAEMQARWAGAIWLRAGLQTQLAAHMLSGGATSPGDYASAVALWALGIGQHIKEIVDLAEPRFDEASADFVVRHLTRSSSVAGRFDQRLIEAAVECWDLISEDAATELLDRFTPVKTDHPVIRRIALLWSLLSLRVPEEWASRFERLNDEEASALLATTTPAVAERLPRPAARRLYELGAVGTVEVDLLPTLATLADRFDLDDDYEIEDPLPPVTIVRLAWRGDRAEDAPQLKEAVRELTDTVKRVVADARRGKGGMGRYSPFNTLASAVARLGSVPAGTLEQLRETVTDPGIPRQVRYDAVKVLVAAVANDALDLEHLPELIRSIPDAGAEPFWEEYSPALMRAAKTELAMAGGLIEQYLPQALVLSRHSDTRVRLDAIESCILGRQNSNDYMLESIVLSGLFDPSPAVTQRAITGFAARLPERIAAQAALGERLKELFTSAGREVRAAIAGLLASVELTEALVEIGTELRARATNDRSYQVRTEAAKPPSK